MKFTGRKRSAGIFLMALLGFAIGHVFLLSPEVVSAAGLPLTEGVAHHDTAPHSPNDHVSCPNDLHQFSYNRGENLSTHIYDFTLDSTSIQPVDAILIPTLIGYVFSSDSLPPDLPLDRKTQLLI